MAVKGTTIFWSAIAGFGAVRALYRPWKAVVRDGAVTACAGGPGCSPSLTVQSVAGVAPVYSLVSGRVVSASAQELTVAARDEPVLVTYRGALQLGPVAQVGARVGSGQAVAHSSQVEVSVSRISRDASGKLSLVPLEPASWMSARGLRASAKRAGASGLWCDQGRRMVVPQRVGQCGLRLPEPAAFALLPVSVSME